LVLRHRKHRIPRVYCCQERQRQERRLANSTKTQHNGGKYPWLSGIRVGMGTGPNSYFSLQAGPAFSTGATGTFKLAANTFESYPRFSSSGDGVSEFLLWGKKVGGKLSVVDWSPGITQGLSALWWDQDRVFRASGTAFMRKDRLFIRLSANARRTNGNCPFHTHPQRHSTVSDPWGFSRTVLHCGHLPHNRSPLG
jgi:hypothetical protein